MDEKNKYWLEWKDPKYGVGGISPMNQATYQNDEVKFSPVFT